MPVIKNLFPQAAAALLRASKASELATSVAIAQKARNRAPVRTGRLRASIHSAGPLVAATAPYAGFQEFGTRKMPAHPFFVPAVHEEKNRPAEMMRLALMRYA